MSQITEATPIADSARFITDPDQLVGLNYILNERDSENHQVTYIDQWGKRRYAWIRDHEIPKEFEVEINGVTLDAAEGDPKIFAHKVDGLTRLVELTGVTAESGPNDFRNVIHLATASNGTVYAAVEVNGDTYVAQCQERVSLIVEWLTEAPGHWWNRRWYSDMARDSRNRQLRFDGPGYYLRVGERFKNRTYTRYRPVEIPGGRPRLSVGFATPEQVAKVRKIDTPKYFRQVNWFDADGAIVDCFSGDEAEETAVRWAAETSAAHEEAAQAFDPIRWVQYDSPFPEDVLTFDLSESQLGEAGFRVVRL